VGYIHLNEEKVTNVGAFTLQITSTKNNCIAKLESYWCSTDPSSGKSNCGFEWLPTESKVILIKRWFFNRKE